MAGALVAVLLVGGCATNNPRDPLEPMNRVVYKFNDGFDRAIAKPVAQGYRAVVPEIARTGVTNFFSNLDDVWVVVNQLLQGKPKTAIDDFGRVMLNSTVGLFGLVDIASDRGLPKHNEDFGQTLGRWGVTSGPYLVIPFFGPSDFRDALGWGLVDVHGDLVGRIHDVPTRNTLYGVRLINTRANLLDASRLLDDAALDPYSFLREAYLQRRQSLVYDGNPPPENRDSEEGGGSGSTSNTGSAANAGSAPAATPPAAAPLGGKTQ